MSILCCDHYCQDLGVHSKRKNLEQIHSRNVCQHIQSTQYQWTVQYNKRRTYFAGAGKGGLEFENGQSTKDRSRIGFYCGLNVRSCGPFAVMTYTLYGLPPLEALIAG